MANITIRSAVLSVTFAMILSAGSAWAQSGTVERSSNLRSDPSMGRAPIRLLTVGEKVDLTGKLQNGYYQVRTSHSEVGWAWARNVSIVATEVSDVSSKRLQLLTATNLRRGPSAQESPVRLLQGDESLRLVEPAPHAGYYHVRTATGEDGWVWGRAGIITDAASAGTRVVESAPPVPQPAPVAKVAPPAPAPKVEEAPAVAEAPKPVAPKVEAAPVVAEAPKPAAPKVEEVAPVAEAPKPAPKVAEAPAVVAAAQSAAPKIEEPPVVAEAPKAAPRVEEPPVVAEAPKPQAPAPRAADVQADAPVARESHRDSGGGLQVGDVLDRSTAHLAKDMLPEELLRHYEQGEYVNSIVSYPTGSRIWEQSFVDATRHNAQTLTVNEHGTIIDKTTGLQPQYVYGIPFPDVDRNDPQAAVKIIWNQFLAVWYNGSAHTNTKVIMFNARNVEREIGAEGWFKFYDGEPAKYRTDNPLDLQAQALALAMSPSDIQGTASLQWRYRDPNKRDSQWAFVPALRRVRAVSPANRSDGYLGSDISADDGYFFDGKPEDFEWRVIDKRDAFRMVDPEAAAHQIKPRPVNGGGWESLTNREGYYGYETEGWSGLPWGLPKGGLARRPVWIIEAIPRDKYYLYGRLVLWIDAETWDGSYHQKFNWNGEHVLTYQVLARITQPTGPRPEDETTQVSTQAWAVAENFKMHRASMAGARLNPRSPYDRRVPVNTELFDAGQLTRMGK